MFTFTRALVLIISAVSLYGFYNRDFFERYLFDLAAVRGKRDWVRLLSSGFLHVGVGHLFFNMYSFYSFATALEKVYSPLLVAAVFFLSVLGGNLFSLVVNRKKTDWRAVGASGGVCGILYAYIFLMEGGSIRIMFLPVDIPVHIYAVAFLLVSYILMKREVGNIGHDAHIGGAVTGTLSAIVIIPWVILEEWYIMLAMFAPIAALMIFDGIRERRKSIS